MNREKQIEEMARITCSLHRGYLDNTCGGNSECDFNCHHYNRCEALYNAGYRKQSEVAAEIFAEIDEMFRKDLQRYNDAIEPTDGEEIKRIFNSHIISAETYRGTIAELKKKYTEATHGPKRTN